MALDLFVAMTRLRNERRAAGVACPGVIDADGAIEKGAQNLPGNWESSRFIPAELIEAIPGIGDHNTAPC